MRRPELFEARKRKVLNDIVRTYIETGEPVASRSIARRAGERLSAATIRNVMVDLDDEGYLSQPHTSAGRVPTAKAFRSYVYSLDAQRLLAAELERLRAELSEVETLEGRVERSSHMLTEMTRSMGIAAAMTRQEPVLEQIDLLALSDQRVLMIVVTRDRMVRDRVIRLDEALTQDELNSIRNYINLHFTGWSLPEVRRELARRLAAESAAYDRILNRLIVLYSRGLLDVDASPEVHMEGASNLVGLDLHLTKEKLRALFRLLEEKKRIVQLLDRFFELPAGEVSVQVGLGEAHPAMEELALIGVPVTLPNGLSAVIAVLGPMRMNYGRAISAVMHVGRAFENA